jgi:hypothetical protein
VEGSCEHGNEPSDSIKCWEILEWLHNWHLLKKGSSPWIMFFFVVVQISDPYVNIGTTIAYKILSVYLFLPMLFKVLFIVLHIWFHLRVFIFVSKSFCCLLL